MGRALAYVCAVTLAFSGGTAVLAQSPEGRERPDRSEQPERPAWARPTINRFALVLEHRADLALTAEQVTRLDSMRAALAERNRPLEEQARSIIGSTRPGAEEGSNVVERDVAQANFERVRKVREQVQKNDKDAWKEGEKVLTRDQKKKADKLISQREDELKGDRPGFQGRRGGPMSGRHRPGSPQ